MAISENNFCLTVGPYIAVAKISYGRFWAFNLLGAQWKGVGSKGKTTVSECIPFLKCLKDPMIKSHYVSGDLWCSLATCIHTGWYCTYSCHFDYLGLASYW